MDDALAKRGRSLEEAFFIKRDAELIAQRKKLEEMQKTKEALGEVSGIRDAKVLDKLVELGISPAILAPLSILPLVEVAWADGELSEAEKKTVLEAAGRQGLSKDSANYAMLESWLIERPSAKLLEAWIQYIQGLRGAMGEPEMMQLKTDLLCRARNVANSSGGFMGLGSKVSPEEKAVLKKMEDAFNA